jgi:hypothetical protein
MTKRCLQAMLTVAIAGGCNVIKSDLLDVADAPRADARPPQDAPIDAKPDAYEPFMGNLVGNPGVETGTLGWTTNGGSAQIAATTTIFHAGASSLVTTGRTAAWNGPAVSLFDKIRPNRSYGATVFARLVVAATDKFYISTRHTCAEDAGTQHFNQATTRTFSTASDTAWTQPTSTFTVAGPPACTLTSFIVYVETENTTLSEFYVDDLDVQEQQ